MSSSASHRIRSTSFAVICVGNIPAPTNSVAIGSTGAISSPASCRRTNVSYGRSALNALITMSREWYA
jgi:hypothetical protein